MKLKKSLLLILALILSLSLTACGSDSSGDSDSSGADGGDERVTVKVGIVGESYQQIWAPVIEEAAKEGIDIQLINFSDYSLPNPALNDGEVDLNAFQHHAFFDNEVELNGYKLTSIGDTFISAMCIYSDEISDISELKDGDSVVLPNDATNQGRALKVLAGAGLIKTDPDAGASPEVRDVVSNPLNLNFIEVDAANVPSLLPDATIGVINANYALDFGFSPANDAIFYDDVNFYSDDSYANLIAARTEEKDNPAFKRIVELYQTDAVEAVFLDAFEGSYIAAWK